MSRLFIEDIKGAAQNLNKNGISEITMTVVTGRLGIVLIDRYIKPILAKYLPEHKIGFLSASNTRFGDKVTVTGLLSGRDIIRTVNASHSEMEPVVLPPNCINHEGYFLDDMKLEDLQRELGRKVLIPENTFLDSEIVEHCINNGEQ